MRREDVLLTLEALTTVNGEWVPEFLIPLSMEGSPGQGDLWRVVG